MQQHATITKKSLLSRGVIIVLATAALFILLLQPMSLLTSLGDIDIPERLSSQVRHGAAVILSLFTTVLILVISINKLGFEKRYGGPSIAVIASLFALLSLNFIYYSALIYLSWIGESRSIIPFLQLLIAAYFGYQAYLSIGYINRWTEDENQPGPQVKLIGLDKKQLKNGLYLLAALNAILLGILAFWPRIVVL